MNEDGMIQLDSPLAKEFGFTSDKFAGYLWQRDNAIWISFIESLHPGRGNLSNLFNTIWSKGFTIKVPTPMGKMIFILQRKKFHPTVETTKEFGPYDVWVKEPNPTPGTEKEAKE